ncbi:MAG: 30S ribosomal protein S2 [Candidatus Pacebacteria bacterium]|nr:30S ribosomal protein S2 [Candidatus Paceibacterota bacterium]
MTQQKNQLSEGVVSDSEKDKDIFSEMKKAGLHYGHKKTFNNPKAANFTLKSFSELNFIDLNETKKRLEAAIDFVKEIIRKKEVILFVGTNPAAREGIRLISEKYGFPFVSNRWLGGTLTNIKTLMLRIKYLKDLKDKKESPEWEKYTKQERRKMECEIEKLEQKFAGLTEITKLPEALFVVDPKIHDTAIREARIIGIPVIAILDTDDDPNSVAYPIPANDSAKSSIDYILNKIGEAIETAKKEMSLADEEE